MTLNIQDKKQTRKSKQFDPEKSLAEKRLLIDKLKTSLMNSRKNNSKDTEEIEFLLRRL
jgi:hypothetical protein